MVALFWNPGEADSGAYDTVEQHSAGMISFAYSPPSETDLGPLKNTETYRRLVKEGGVESLGLSPEDQEAANQA